MLLRNHPDPLSLVKSTARSSGRSLSRGSVVAWRACNRFVQRQHARVSRIAADFWDLVR